MRSTTAFHSCVLGNPELTVDELRPFHAQEWADSYDVSVTSRRNYLRSIKTCLRWCCKQGDIDKNPLQHMDIPVADRKEVYVSPEEFDRLLEHVTDRPRTSAERPRRRTRRCRVPASAAFGR